MNRNWHAIHAAINMRGLPDAAERNTSKALPDVGTWIFTGTDLSETVMNIFPKLPLMKEEATSPELPGEWAFPETIKHQCALEEKVRRVSVSFHHLACDFDDIVELLSEDKTLNIEAFKSVLQPIGRLMKAVDRFRRIYPSSS